MILFTLLCFGCATVRVPVVTAAEPADVAGTVAAPLLELWLESSQAVRPAERADAERQARAAIDAALAREKISPGALGAGDAVLFVRERGVALTTSRQSQQIWAKVGIVAGIVVVVAVVVIAAVASGKNSKQSTGSKSSAPATAGPAPAAVAVRPRAAAVSPPGPSSLGAVASGGPRAGPVSGTGRPVAHPPAKGPAQLPPPRVYVYGYAPAPLFFDLQFYYAPRPLVLRSEEPPEDQPYPGAPLPPGQDENDAREPSVERVAEAPDRPALLLPPLAPEADFAVESRGYFSSAQTSLQLDLLDRETGTVLWSKTVASGADPLSTADVAALLDTALAGVAWARRAR